MAAFDERAKSISHIGKFVLLWTGFMGPCPDSMMSVNYLTQSGEVRSKGEKPRLSGRICQAALNNLQLHRSGDVRSYEAVYKMLSNWMNIPRLANWFISDRFT